MSRCGHAFWPSMLFAIFASGAPAEEINSFTEWQRVNSTHPFTAGRAMAFGTVTDSFPADNLMPIGLAFDADENGIWLGNEDGGELLLIDVEPPHDLIRSINIQAFHLTTDGNQDGVAVIGDDLYLTDFEGDQYMVDDLIYRLDRVSGALLGWWFVDGLQNTNENAHINMILGISDDGAGNFWVTDNEGNLHNISLLDGGEWVQNSVQAVPGGGTWAGIDYDTCLEEFFIADLGSGVFNHHTAMPALPETSAPAAGPDVNGITSNNAGVIWTVGTGNDMIYVHEGIACQVPIKPASWGEVKALFR